MATLFTRLSVVRVRRFNTAETTSTIRFGSSAKTIKNKPRVNVSKSVKELEDALEAANKQVGGCSSDATAMSLTLPCRKVAW